MKRLRETINVNNEKALADALQEQYGMIVVEGDVADSMRKSLEQYRKKQKIQSLASVGLIAGLLFWPLFVASLATALITADDLNRYKVDCTSSNVVLTHKKNEKRQKSL